VICEDVPDFKMIRREVVHVVCKACEQLTLEWGQEGEEFGGDASRKGAEGLGGLEDREDDGLEAREDDGLFVGMLKGLARSASQRNSKSNSRASRSPQV
jgi:hypothetical protein